MSFEQNLSPAWIEDLYQRWLQEPHALPPDWQAFFRGYTLAEGATSPTAAAPAADPEAALRQSAVQSLIYRYRDLGHLLACTDPLSSCPTSHPLLELEAFDLSEDDLEQTFHTRRFSPRSAPLREIVAVLRETYCRSIGVEFMHIQDPAERQWLIDRMEPVRNRPAVGRERQLRLLEKLQQAALFEAFLHRHFLGQKRFSLEGGDLLIPLLDLVVEHGANIGVHEIVLGMAHRGRLNVLANIFKKPLASIFAEFADNLELHFVGDGDVKYHKGFSTDYPLDDAGGHLHLTLAPNPSHLEAVDAVVEGKCRARQDEHCAEGEDGEKLVLPVLLHGDAAFAGQGMVAETLNLSQLAGYRTGGTLHVVLNNQIGFTTTREDARSTHYATAVAKMLAIPIFHVHGENPEAVAHVTQLALDYRQHFGKDVVIEIICYRRHGHNEGDEPYFTQPLMYDRIKERPPLHELYAEQLQQQGIDAETLQARAHDYEKRLEEALASKETSDPDGGFSGKWEGIVREAVPFDEETGVNEATLVELCKRLVTLPSGFTPHPKIAKLLEKRLEAIEQKEGIDWGNAETLAFATLLAEGKSIRLSGQDCRRGTFNHRHSTLVDLHTGESEVPLAQINPAAPFRVYNSLLSEEAVLGFEFGYSLETPHGLTIWEAQFGDFANGAQVIIDQFISSCESKWDRSSGLALFLPHGYEGQGAEHSSARIERYLQLCARNNLQVVYPTTPAQLFHLLRRQLHQPFRRPLVVFTPKSLLRLPACRSTLAELTGGRFQEILPDPTPPKKATSLVLCSGKIFYDLDAGREKESVEDVALLRIEQLYPLRRDALEAACAPYAKVERLVWAQEEPANMGAWNVLRPQLREIFGREPLYVGREAAAAPAVGSHRQHGKEQEAIVATALNRA